MRSRDRTTWDAGSELMRDEQEEQEQAASNGDEMDMDEGDAVSVRSKDAESTKDSASVASGKDTTKKRSRTLTTAHQTAVLNALLAKVRSFGSRCSRCFR